MSSIQRTAESTSTPAPRLGALATALVAGGVLALLSTTVVGVAVPDLADDLRVSEADASWVATVALLAAGVAIPLSGWATIRFGTRATWLVALGLFAVGLAASALAPTFPVLVVARVVQGLGAGALEPIMLTALARAVDPARMGRVMGSAAAAMSIGPLLGPVTGGFLVGAVGWRAVFGVLAVVAAVLWVVSLLVVRDDERAPAALDLVGLLLLSAATTALLAGFSRAAAPDGVDPLAIALVVSGAVALLAFVRWARRRGTAAVVDLGTFSARGYGAAVAVMALLGAAVYPAFFGLPQLFQSVGDLSPAAAGLLVAPYGLGTLIAMPLTGRLSDSVSTGLLVRVGAGVAAVGFAGYPLAGLLDGGARLALYALLGLVVGLGIGSVGSPTVSSIYRALPPERIAPGTTILFVTNQLGGALGVAVLAGIVGILGGGRWDADVAGWPLTVPVVACLAVAGLSARLASADGAPANRATATA
ncbi:DHA2 family efflux MFS transporter permease subunit [Promicromonospora sp. NPDC090134]|uniref:DHA2 family efflux MFS transporter permease subunit n=1 Tax=Promicromonospora sp. NPDC090134 TaxID=3364408 RepID=UPI0038295D7F